MVLEYELPCPLLILMMPMQPATATNTFKRHWAIPKLLIGEVAVTYQFVQFQPLSTHTPNGSSYIERGL